MEEIVFLIRFLSSLPVSILRDKRPRLDSKTLYYVCNHLVKAAAKKFEVKPLTLDEL